MIKVSILYPNVAQGRFDFDYYLSRHMPRSIELLGAHPGFHSVTVERGLGGARPGSPPEYLAACFYVFDSVESFIAAFIPHVEELQDDAEQYTDIAAEVQFNEIVVDLQAAGR